MGELPNLNCCESCKQHTIGISFASENGREGGKRFLDQSPKTFDTQLKSSLTVCFYSKKHIKAAEFNAWVYAF